GYAAWLVYQMPNLEPQRSSLGQQIDTIERTAARTGELREIDARLGRIQSERQDDLAAIRRDVDSAVSEIRREMGTSSEDWLMAEVEYLLRLANHRVLLERDPEGAIALFQAADEIVRDAEGITAFELREAIANDIAKLKVVRKVDTDGIFLELSALKGLVGQLEQKKLAFTPAEEPETIRAEEPSGWLDRILAMLKRAGTRLAGLVEYRSDSERITPVLPPDEEYYLRQNLTLKLQLAQLALLRGEKEVYTTSLAEARTWVMDNFANDDRVTRAMINGLDNLAQIDISREMPDVSDSLREVRALLASFHQAEDKQ
ncbi:MAG: uroporphyrinogen-III C-methyltransferase, partial [Pseudomonadales bacterium]|nr:uroporphyrinogen-III C-methyltransferase [Pseudomonadales bacterium]